MKITGFIQARMSSTRLPGKSLKEIKEKPLIWYVVNRAKKCGLLNEVNVLMPENSKDDELALYCEENKIQYYRGSEDNVFQRFQDATKKFNPDVIVRLTGDNPFIDINFLEGAIKLHLETKADFTSTRKMQSNEITERYLPKGFSIDIFNKEAILNADISKMSDFEKEHIIPYFFNNAFKISYFKPDLSEKFLEYEFSVDTLEDFKYAEKILNHINWDSFTFSDIISIERG